MQNFNDSLIAASSLDGIVIGAAENTMNKLATMSAKSTIFFGRAVHEWKALVLGLVILGCGFVLGDTYQHARSEELLRVSRVAAETTNLYGASILLLAMKNYSASCPRSLVQGMIENGMLYARASSVSHPITSADVELDKAIKFARQALDQKDSSEMDLSRGSDVEKK